jgi:DNA-binding IclR family transcriptional regulator
MTDDTRGPLAIDRAFAVLGLLAARPAGASLADLARALDVPKTSLLGVLRGMAAGGYVVLAGRLYRAGPASHALAQALTHANRTIGELGEPILRRLALDSGETSVLAVMTADERAIEYVAKIESQTALRFAATVGDRRPLHASAGGRLLVAYRDDAWIDRFLADARLDRATGSTIIDPDALRTLFHSIRADGFATTSGDMTDEVAGLAVPVFGEAGAVRAALLIGGPIERVARQREHLLGLLQRAAADLSRIML